MSYPTARQRTRRTKVQIAHEKMINDLIQRMLDGHVVPVLALSGIKQAADRASKACETFHLPLRDDEKLAVIIQAIEAEIQRVEVKP